MPDQRRDANNDYTKKQRSQAFRDRTRSNGLVELRGVQVPAEMVEAAKAVVRQMVADWNAKNRLNNETTETELTMWECLDKARPESAHYSVMRLASNAEGMDALRAMFPDAKASGLNFVLFSTSGVHGTYHAIEEAERFLNGADAEGHSEVTFVIVHPRLVAMRYGVCNPKTQDDIEYLKRLRASSQEAVATIGVYTPPNVEVTG